MPITKAMFVPAACLFVVLAWLSVVLLLVTVNVTVNRFEGSRRQASR
jgi:hypothetical protein